MLEVNRNVFVLLFAFFLILTSSCSHRQKMASSSGQTPAPSISPSAVSKEKKNLPPMADVHFHVRNYIQHGITLEKAHDILAGQGVQRAAVFGIPLQQRWDMTTKVTPSYYLHDDQALYYYSAIDAIVAAEYQALPKSKQAVFDPMIVGFNPTDGRAVDHIRTMLIKFPNTFTGIGEFSIKKEVVSSKITGDAANLEDPALGKILEFAGEVGLVVLLHCDLDAMISHNLDQPTYLESLEALFEKYRKTKIIWAHTGLGRYVKARSGHIQLLRRLFSRYPNLYVDISWDVVAEQFFQGKGLRPEWKQLLSNHSKKILFGTDVVAPSMTKYQKVLELYQRVWKELPQDAVLNITYRNYQQLFDRARSQVRSWEKRALKASQ